MPRASYSPLPEPLKLANIRRLSTFASRTRCTCALPAILRLTSTGAMLLLHVLLLVLSFLGLAAGANSLCAVTFSIAFTILVAHVAFASLTRRLHVLPLVLGLNAVIVSANTPSTPVSKSKKQVSNSGFSLAREASFSRTMS